MIYTSGHIKCLYLAFDAYFFIGFHFLFGACRHYAGAGAAIAIAQTRQLVQQVGYRLRHYDNIYGAPQKVCEILKGDPFEVVKKQLFSTFCTHKCFIAILKGSRRKHCLYGCVELRQYRLTQSFNYDGLAYISLFKYIDKKRKVMPTLF